MPRSQKRRSILDNCLTINNGRLAGKVGSGLDMRVAVAPIMAVAGEYARLPPVEQHLAAITVVFDFVNSVLPSGG